MANKHTQKGKKKNITGKVSVHKGLLLRQRTYNKQYNRNNNTHKKENLIENLKKYIFIFIYKITSSILFGITRIVN